MPRKRQQNLWPLLIIALLLIIAAAIYAEWLKKPPAGQPLDNTPDLVSDQRLVFGGAPRPLPGAGPEVSFTTLKNQGYIVGYSDARRDPLWVVYRVYHTDQAFDFPRPSKFSTDMRTQAQVKETDFARSGYDRGHMAPNAAIMHDYGRDAQIETFLLSNICPQSPELNERVWERLEVAERGYADKEEEVWVIDGPIFSDIAAGKDPPRLASGVTVPMSFYKILIDEQGHAGGKPRVFSVIMPQDVKGTELPQQYLSTVSEIEQKTHLEFLWKLDAQTQAELKGKQWKMW